MPDTILCGKRGDLSYLTGVRVESEDAEKCPIGTIACSTNGGASGATYCVADEKKCPVTKLLIVPEGDPKLVDPRYVTREAQGTDKKHFIAFTKEAGESNSPV